jgi:hypothetical protein
MRFPRIITDLSLCLVFPAAAFASQVLPLVFALVTRSIGRPPHSKRLIAERMIEDAIDDLRSMLEEGSEELDRVIETPLLNGYPEDYINGRASPLKRRAEQVDVSLDSPLQMNGLQSFA